MEKFSLRLSWIWDKLLCYSVCCGAGLPRYPIGGDTQSVTAGVVSRIEVTDYTHGSIDLLAIQIDAAINSA